MTLLKTITTLSVSSVLMACAAPCMAQSTTPKFRHVGSTASAETTLNQAGRVAKTSAGTGMASIKSGGDTIMVPRSVEEIIESVSEYQGYMPKVNMSATPKVFVGYRHLESIPYFLHQDSVKVTPEIWRAVAAEVESESRAERRDIARGLVSEIREAVIADPDAAVDDVVLERALSIANGDNETERVAKLVNWDRTMRPDWLLSSLAMQRMQTDVQYQYMMQHPLTIEYSYWDLPVPPSLPEEDYSLRGYLSRLDLPEVVIQEVVDVNVDLQKRHWLHVFNTGLQFSQAYLSKNWYQGGNDYLALLFNFYWDVQLNPVYHPNLLFQSTFSYKLGLNSVQDDEFHKYSISQDLLQYNLRFGYKAAHNWYYSFQGQFKTQLLNNYPRNSQTRIASFLSPGDLNLGFGMTYSKTNANKTLSFKASLSPIAYNMKCCIDPKIDVGQFNIKPGHKVSNEFGSTAELTFDAQIWGNVSYKTRMFLFSDYSYFQGDWENTLNFQFNKFFSTQLYVNIRYDSSSPRVEGSNWNHWMIKEILSVGLSYSFSTK